MYTNTYPAQVKALNACSTYIIINICSKLRVKDTTNASTAAQNNQEGIYSLLQPLEDNNTVCAHM